MTFINSLEHVLASTFPMKEGFRFILVFCFIYQSNKFININY